MFDRQDFNTYEKIFRDSTYYWPVMIFVGFAPAIILVVLSTFGVRDNTFFFGRVMICFLFGHPVFLYAWSVFFLREFLKGWIGPLFGGVFLAVAMTAANSALAFAGCSSIGVF